MRICTIDPLTDTRWEAFAASHPQASIFHTKGWLRALAATYGYKPLALTSSAVDQGLSNGAVFCEVKSWITGKRLISLPFADHAEILLDRGGDASLLEEWVREAHAREGWKYVELRPVSWAMEADSLLQPSELFWLHTLDVTAPLERLFRNLHRSCVQRRIRHAERQGLAYERGRSGELLGAFYQLLVTTRKRHRLLPQPRAWFRNLIAELGPNAEIRMASKDGVPVAALFTLRHRATVVYKYGCSDERLHHLAGMPFLFWKLIEESNAEGAEQIDFGRTEIENEGLVEFKDRLGAARTKLSYLRYPRNASASSKQHAGIAAGRALAPFLPNSLSSNMGSIVYRHIA